VTWGRPFHALPTGARVSGRSMIALQRERRRKTSAGVMLRPSAVAPNRGERGAVTAIRRPVDDVRLSDLYRILGRAAFAGLTASRLIHWLLQLSSGCPNAR
jgi:hypothetical protein